KAATTLAWEIVRDEPLAALRPAHPARTRDGMHREISHTDQAFQRESDLSLYALTALVGCLIGLDLWPLLAEWIDPGQSWLITWRNEINGYRLYALSAAVLGGARALYGSLERLAEGRIGA